MSTAVVVHVPHARYPTWAVQVLTMRDTLVVWCGVLPKAQYVAVCEARSQPLPPESLELGARLAADWSVAMRVPGGGGTPGAPAPPSTLSTSLFHARGDVSRGMAQRIGTLRH